MNRKMNVRLKNLRFFSRIGFFEQERAVGNEFEVNMEISFDASIFVEEDISTTVSYADIYSIIEEEMMRESLLLETVANRIAERTMAITPNNSRISISIDKLTPPIKGISGSCGIELTLQK